MMSAICGVEPLGLWMRQAGKNTKCLVQPRRNLQSLHATCRGLPWTRPFELDQGRASPVDSLSTSPYRVLAACPASNQNGIWRLHKLETPGPGINNGHKQTKNGISFKFPHLLNPLWKQPNNLKWYQTIYLFLFKHQIQGLCCHHPVQTQPLPQGLPFPQQYSVLFL